MAQHVKIVGILHIVLGAFGILGALTVFLMSGGISGFLAMNPEVDAEARAVIPFIAVIGSGLALFILALSIPGVIIGFGLLRLRPWARTWGIVLSAIDLIHVPFGTIIGVYGLWALLQTETEALFRQTAFVAPYPGGQAPPMTK